MPQITVQYPEALAAGFDRRGFALATHAAASDLISSALGGFKTRFLALDETVVGDGSPHHHMVHAIVDILPGRPEELKERLGKLILGLLKEHLTIPSAYSVQVTTEIRELQGYYQLVLP
ncbi:5-carboxymethyl-2-hydroxymuconate Delta-isomerase [Streptomyces sp. NPDC048448]|uniref:5-carboxymethyl-2-hydroxymuconate Delta-isomerase n=1 Tax=unclassified Streptomyces TaxID=2593676 RepID=UPI00371375B0